MSTIIATFIYLATITITPTADSTSNAVTDSNTTPTECIVGGDISGM